jgi:hypothetical protein
MFFFGRRWLFLGILHFCGRRKVVAKLVITEEAGAALRSHSTVSHVSHGVESAL